MSDKIQQLATNIENLTEEDVSWLQSDEDRLDKFFTLLNNNLPTEEHIPITEQYKLINNENKSTNSKEMSQLAREMFFTNVLTKIKNKKAEKQKKLSQSVKTLSATLYKDNGKIIATKVTDNEELFKDNILSLLNLNSNKNYGSYQLEDITLYYSSQNFDNQENKPDNQGQKGFNKKIYQKFSLSIRGPVLVI